MKQTALWIIILVFWSSEVWSAPDIPPARMQAIYEQVKTPYKVGIVVLAPAGKKVDCPNVFRYHDKWVMVYVQLEPKPQQGYTTQLAVSDDLLTWKPLGTILQRGSDGDWDHANVGGGVALFNTEWGGDNTLETFQGRTWMTYLGGKDYGYEKIPLAIGLASTTTPGSTIPWVRQKQPILTVHDPNVRSFESGTLYKSFVFQDKSQTLGAPFVMFYNAKPARGSETIGLAISHDLRHWQRYGQKPVIAHYPPADKKVGVISGDPQVVRMDDLWVMFYFGAFWQPGAFDTFAASRDLVHWTLWQGPHLIEPSKPWDKTFAHKPWLLKYHGVVYHFYCAVGDQGRAIALATSKPVQELRP